jgi:hypothetical protein
VEKKVIETYKKIFDLEDIFSFSHAIERILSD